MKPLMTTAAVAALVWLPPAIPTSAQIPWIFDTTLPFCKDGWNEARCRIRPFPAPGMIPCRAGEPRCDTTYTGTEEGWRPPTVTEALEALERKKEPAAPPDYWPTPDPYHPARAILRQVFGPRPAAELDAFADRVAGMMADTALPEHVWYSAKSALAGAADAAMPVPGTIWDTGTPYPRAFDLLARVYEGGTDDEQFDGLLLSTIFRVTGSERGPAYVRALFERSERPPMCVRGEWVEADLNPPECDNWWNTLRLSPWCRAGRLLYEDIVREAIIREWGGIVTRIAGDPAPVPDGLPEHVEDWHRRCR